MLSFKEWLYETEMNEGWQDWGKKAALGGALLSAGMGIGRLTNTGDDIPSSSVTYPAATQFIQQRSQRALDTATRNQDGTYSVTVMKRGGPLSSFDAERLPQNRANMILLRALKGNGRTSIINKKDNGKTITYTYKLS